MKIAKFVLPAIAAGFMASSASAATATWSIDGDNTVAGTVANTLTADGEGVDWTGGVLLVNLTSGSVHNDVAFGGDGPVPSFWGLVAGLEWDTWVGADVDNNPGNADPIGNGIAGGAGDLGDPAFSMSGQKISVTWFDTETSDTVATRVANITLSDDAAGTWSLITSYAGGLLVEDSGTVEAGALVPEPASLALLGLGGLAALRRR